MSRATVPFLDILSIPLQVKDFLSHRLEGINIPTFSIENAKKQSALKGNQYSKEKREVLVKALSKQLRSFDLSQKQIENLTLLSLEKTFTVVTGHQLNLGTGPVFFIYKILQTIKTANFLNENCKEFSYVPIFWLASEDHDFDEINHFHTENKKYSINAKSGGVVGKIKDFEGDFLTQFKNEFKDSPFGKDLILLFENAYKKGNSLSDATKILVQELFASYGLLFIDGDDAALKKEMKPIFEDELQNQSLFHTTKNTNDFLIKKFHKLQVNPREINLFYLSETRDRIEKKDTIYHLKDKKTSFTFEELLSEPEKISPNALMRPVYQETILPNIIYIGGNAEIVYWMQLVDYFTFLNLPFPILIPRNSIVFLKEKTYKKIEKSPFLWKDFLNSISSIYLEQKVNYHAIQKEIEQLKESLVTNFAQLKNSSKLTDITFENLVNAEEKRQLNSFDRMSRRLLRAEKIKNQEELLYFKNLECKFLFNGVWQERGLNFSHFYASYGEKWIDLCFEIMNVENSELIINSY